MKKYLYIFKSELMTNFQYIFDLILGFVGYAIMLFILMNLWQYLYDDPNQIINGYTYSQMVWYVIITEILWSVISGRKLCQKISMDVKTGNIAYNINKPYSYIGYILSTHLGDIVIKGVIYSILGMILGFIFIGSFPNISFISILLVLISCIFSNVISIFFICFIGLFSLFIEDSGPFYWLYSKVILVLGTIFPIEYFPEVIRPILKFSPVYVISYGPAKLFVDFNYNNALSIIVAQIIYILLSYLLCLLVYKKGVKKLNVNGG
ncbi:MAG: ABC transporter permease [Bacilli bacterium]